MDPPECHGNTRLLLKLLNSFSQFLSLSHRKSKRTSSRTSTFCRPCSEQRCSKCFARNMSCILTEEMNESYLTYFEGFKWVRQRMVKKSWEMWSDTSFYSWENWGQGMRWILGRALRTAGCVTVTLMKKLCLFKKLSRFLLSTKHFREFFLPQTEQAQLWTSVTNVSPAALARPSPSYDPENGKLLRPVRCYGL